MSEELFSETDHLTFNEEDFNNLQSALMLKESECIVESQQSTNLSDDGLLKVLSFDSEVNISTTLADQSVNSSSQSCKETTTKVKKSVLKTYERKGKRKIEVAPKVIKRSGRKKFFSGNNSKSDVNSKSPQIKNQNIGKKSEIRKSECRLDDEEDEYTLNKIRKNMFDCSGSRDDREKSVNSDNVSTETVIRKRGRPKKTISVTEKTKNISKNNKSIVTCEESQGTIGKVTCKAGRPPKKKNVKVYVDSTCSTTEPAIESSVLQSTNVDCINKFDNIRDFDDLVVEDLKKNPGALEDDKNYSKNKISNSDHKKLNEAPTEVKEQINKVQLDLSNDDSNNGNSTKRPSRMPEMPDFEYNVDSIDREYSNKAIKGRLSDTENQKQNTCSTTETSCGRPQRRKVKHNLRYDECSDEDPFANVELSDDDGEPIGFKKGNKYYSDDEYIPIKKLKKVSESFTSDSDIEKKVDELKKPRKKRKNIKTKKNEKTPNVDTLQKDTNKSEATIFTHIENSQHNENNELYLVNQHKRSILDSEQSSIIESEPEEIENYLAKKIQGSNLKIKRVSNIKPTAITPIDIPVIDSYTAKKSIDAWSQTNILKMNSTSVQTMTACDLGMKINVPLSATQREKACEFLKDTVKTISELGELMTQKSEDFIQKKINTKHIIDTFKMDYCVRKSFLMLNLVKHNIMEIEENLAKQDEDFLRENNLLQYREVPKSITPTLILSENDSDCEIIEESSESNSNQSKEKPQPKLNLKTVFLNKELSIKIAKKPSKEQKSREKINIEGKNTVWISDSVLLKKINTKQSFLAQDSRNKKPPDKYVTNEMVSDFFKNYYQQIVSTICAPFISSEWCDLKKINNWCYHFCVEPLKLNNTVKDVNVECNTNENNYIVNSINTKTLLLICVEALQKNMFYLMKKSIRFEGIKPNNYYITDVIDDNKPLKLSLLCIQKIRNMLDKQNVKTISTSKSIKNSYTIVRPLKMLCYNKIIQIFYSSNQDKIKKIQSNRIIVNYPKFRPVKSLVSRSIGYPNVNSHDKSQKKRNNQLQHSTPRSLKQITYYSIVHLMIKHVQQNDVHLNDNNDDKHVSLTTNVQLAENNDQLKNNTPKLLKHIAYSVIDHTMMRGKKSNGVHLNANKNGKHASLTTNVQLTENNDQLENHTPKALKQITYSYIVHLIMKLEQQSASKNDKHVNLRTHVQLTENNDQLKNNTPKSLKHIAFSVIDHTMTRGKKSNAVHLNATKSDEHINLTTSIKSIENNTPKSLKHIAYSVIDHTMTRGKKSNGVHLNADKNDKPENLLTNVQFIENNDQLGNNTPKALKQITYSSIVHLIMKLEQQSALHLSASKNDKHVNLRTNVQLTEINDQLENHTPRSLKQITYYSIVHLMIKHVQHNDVHLNDNKDDKHVSLTTNVQLAENNDQLKNNTPKSLKHITYIHMKQFMCHNKNILITNDYKNKFNVRSKNYMKQVVQQSHKKSEKIVDSELCGPELAQVKSLFKICSEKILLIISHNKESIFHGVHINCANTVPEEMFLNFKNHSLNSKDVIFDTEDLNIQDEYFIENDYDKKTLFQEYNCEYKQNLKDASHCLNQIVNDSNLEQGENINFLSQIKTEAVDNVNLNDGVELYIKTELDESFEEKNIMPQIDNKQLKHENNFNSYAITTEEPVNFCTEYNISKFDNLQYEKQTMCSNSNTEQVVFSQSSSRVRKQFEPDSDNEYDNTMSLLIPQAYETLPTETAHSARKLTCIQKNTSCKKKCDKRKIKKKSLSTKKSFGRQEELVSIKEINKLTENKTTDEEEKSQSSDSDTVINMPLVKRIKRMRKCTKDLKKQRIIIPENEIQCNNVDSTQNVSKNSEIISHNDKSAADCSDVNSNRHVEHNTFINDTLKIKSLTDNSDLRKESSVTDNLQYDEEAQDSEQSFSPVVNLEESVELLGCVPDVSTIAYNIRKREDFSTCEYNMESIKSVENDSCNNENESDFRTIPNNLKWQYHSINSNDAKLYQEAVVVLEKLPDLFVKTCLQLQASAEKNKGVIEVESLKLKTLVEQNNEVIGGCTDTDVQVQQESKTILFASRDLNDDISNDGELDGFSNTLNMEISEKIAASCAVSKEQTVDKKSTLKEKTDLSLEKIDHDVQIKSSEHLKTLDKCAEENENLKSKIKETNDDNLLMLTADKVMKKDLKLLNEPVLVHHEYNDTTSCTDVNKKHPPKKLKRCTTKDGTSVEDRSSSEEEKQWVNTKEKLLKRLVKKQEDSRLDYAKEAKIVSEFIEKCEAPETRKRYRRNSNMRVQKNITELKNNLNNECFGENSEPSHSFGKKGFQSFSKGRRDIRKGTEASEIFEVTKHLKSQKDKHNEVIDKKSLARSTVIANMEENERKRRLHQRQNALKERLGCEENVNVVVINDELCLEYDFEENMPVVCIHNFYTTVMKAHQYEGVKFMWDSCFDTLASIEAGHAGGGCILAHCMGLGKTLQVLALLHTVLTHPRVNMQRVLVCCPLSTVLNWVDEIHKWMRPVTDKIKVFELSKLKKIHERAYQLEDWYKGGGIFIIGYELFRNLTTLDPFTDNIRPTIINKIRTALLEPGPDIIICDEGHLLKNDCSVLAEAMSMVTTKRRIVLTGTPMQNNLREYYCMVNFVKPNLLGRYSEYSNRFENPIMNGQHRDSREEDIKLMKARTHILHKVLEGVLQRQEASVLYPYLPKKHEYTVFIPLSKCQCDLYKHYLIHYTQNKHNTLKDFNILQKIWSHPQVLHNFYLKTRDENSSKVKVEKLEDDLAREDLTASEDITPSQTEMWWMRYLDGDNLLNTLESSNKFLTVFRILEECIAVDDKVLLFSTSLFTMDTLEYFLKKINNWSLGREYYRLDGSVPAEVRQKWCREFNAEINKTTKLFLMSTRAGSLGLNMTAANRVIIFDTSWNPAHDIQSIFRVYRFGQKKDCYIYRLVALGTMEQKIYERSVTKQAVSCRVVDEQQIDRHYNMDELNELYKLDETGAGVACGVSVGVTDVALLRVARDAPLYAVHEHDSLLRGSEEQQLPEDERAAAWRQFEQEQEDKQLENLGKSLQKTTIERPYESDFTPSSSISLDTKKEVKEYISEANTINQNNEIKDCTFVEKEPVQNVEHSGEGTDETNVKEIKENSEDKNIPKNFRKANIEEIVNKMKNIIKAQMQHFSHSNNDTSRNNIKTPLIQSTSKDITTSIVQSTKENLLDYKALDSCSKTEMNNKSNKSNNDLNKNEHKTDSNNPKRICNDKENLSDAQTEESTLTVAEKKKTNERSLDLEKKISGDEDDVWCVEDDNSNLAVTLNEQKENNTQATNHDNKVILLSDAETITDDEEPSQDTTPTPENITSGAANKDNAPGISCILLSDDDDDDIIMNTNQIEKIQSVDILECNDEKINNDDNEKTCLPKSLLTNEIFIKVVAHIYLAKNPTLDKEGALLAARYSAKKAFIETCKTGKGLCSGPLYDIAVNIVGKDILKKIQKQNKGKPAVINLDKVKAKCDHQAKDLANLNQTNIDLTSDDESLTKTNKSQEITIKKGTVRKRVRERLGSSSSDDLIMISDEPKITKRTKIIARAKTVSDPLAIKKSNAKDAFLNRKTKGVEVPSESPSASGKAVSVKKSTSRVKRNSSIPVTASAGDDKARSSSCANSSKAKKRKKNNFRMTLEDFDIDDIDNIIELE